jgi:hypothetical protein
MRTLLHLYAALAEIERSLNSQWARHALKAAVKAEPDRFAGNAAPIIRGIQAAGAASHRALARALNACSDATARGGLWPAVQLGAILKRA